jgi:hypothetical protein
MRLQYRLKPQSYEQQLRDLREERKTEARQIGRLSAELAKKVSFAKVKELPDRTA